MIILPRRRTKFAERAHPPAGSPPRTVGTLAREVEDVPDEIVCPDVEAAMHWDEQRWRRA